MQECWWEVSGQVDSSDNGDGGIPTVGLEAPGPSEFWTSVPVVLRVGKMFRSLSSLSLTFLVVFCRSILYVVS